MLSDVIEIEANIKALKGETRIRLTTETDPTWTTVVDNPFLGKVKKRSVVNATINRNYEDLVNAARVAEGKPADFKCQARKWGQRILDTAIIKHKTETYVEVFVDEVVSSQYVNAVSNTIVPKDLLESFLKPPRITDGPAIRDYKLSSIKSLEIIY